jgi:hypothetical protein
VPDQRKTKRFELKLPLELLLSGSASFEPCETQNVSSGGVLFLSPLQLEVGDLIEYRITLPGGASSPVKLRCRGKVVRLQPGNNGADAHVAATLERYEFVR